MSTSPKSPYARTSSQKIRYQGQPSPNLIDLTPHSSGKSNKTLLMPADYSKDDHESDKYASVRFKGAAHICLHIGVKGV